MIPPIAGVVGYITNVLALQMTFSPLEFWGIEIWRYKDEPWGLFGWQGIIPSKAEKMASVAFELMTSKLFNIREIFQRLEPDKFSEVMSDSVLLMMDEVINEVANEYMPTVWESLPQEVKDDIVLTTDNETGSFLAEFMVGTSKHDSWTGSTSRKIDRSLSHKQYLLPLLTVRHARTRRRRRGRERPHSKVLCS